MASNAHETTQSVALIGVMRLAEAYLGTAVTNQGWFELGGSSLDAARLATRAREEFEIQLSLRDLLQADSLLAYLTEACGSGSGPAETGAASGAADTAAEPLMTNVRPNSITPQSAAASMLWPTLQRLPHREKLELAQLLIAAVQAEPVE
jgi:Phosphopantetheine attachment site